MENYYKKRLELFESHIETLSKEELEICKRINHILDSGIGVMSKDIRISDLEEDLQYVVSVNGSLELVKFCKNVGMFFVEGKNTFLEIREIDSIYN